MKLAFRKFAIVGVVAASTLTLAACNTPGERAAGGALIGAGTGALIGAAATGRTSGALAGAAIGGVGGAVIGANTRPARYGYRRAGGCAEYSYDRWGNPVCVAFY